MLHLVADREPVHHLECPLIDDPNVTGLGVRHVRVRPWTAARPGRACSRRPRSRCCAGRPPGACPAERRRRRAAGGRAAGAASAPVPVRCWAARPPDAAVGATVRRHGRRHGRHRRVVHPLVRADGRVSAAIPAPLEARSDAVGSADCPPQSPEEQDTSAARPASAATAPVVRRVARHRPTLSCHRAPTPPRPAATPPPRRAVRQPVDPEIREHPRRQLLELFEDSDGQPADLHIGGLGRPHRRRSAARRGSSRDDDGGRDRRGQHRARGLPSLLAGERAVRCGRRAELQRGEQVGVRRRDETSTARWNVACRSGSPAIAAARHHHLRAVGRQIALGQLRIREVPVPDELVRHRPRDPGE